jgi:hypothetical protein
MATVNTNDIMANREKAHSTHELEHEGVDKLGNEPRVVLTEEDVSLESPTSRSAGILTVQNRRLCRKTDKRILAVLMWIYFL